MSVQQDDIGGAGRVSPPPVSGASHDLDGGSWCAVTSLPSPAGDGVVLRVTGEIDMSTLALVQTAVDDILAQRPERLVVDLAGVIFCGSRGLTCIVEAGATAAVHGTSYFVSGASTQAERIWALLWPVDQVPARYPTDLVAGQRPECATTSPGGSRRGRRAGHVETAVCMLP